MIVYTRDLPYSLVGAHGSNTNLSGAVSLTPPAGAKSAIIQAIAQNVRMTLDGTVPTATVGFQIRAGDPPTVIDLPTGVTPKVIQETAGAAIQVQWIAYNSDFNQGFS